MDLALKLNLRAKSPSLSESSSPSDFYSARKSPGESRAEVLFLAKPTPPVRLAVVGGQVRGEWPAHELLLAENVRCFRFLDTSCGVCHESSLL